jgi:2-keto-4-pentenoate hydratase/2-oxohepta-3-ene-1,7-dioic acid hydratase in catechol pathway
MKIICIGRNYASHIEELKNERPSEPVVFLKPDSAILLKQHPFVIPEFSDDVHHEIELIVKISKVGKYIEPKFAHKYYDEISVGIDFTARDLQAKLKEKGLPWEKANVTFELKNNNISVQKGNSNKMLWNIDELVSYVSQFFTLKIGDIIFTGTPDGVAAIKSDDVLEGFLEGEKLFRIQVK